LLKIPKGMNFAVLRMIPYLGSDASGTVICERLSEQLNQDIPAAKIYVALKRLEADEFVTSEDETSALAAGRKSRRRRIYRLTEKGALAMEAGMKLYDGQAKELPEWRLRPTAHPNGQSL
jgi:DNA-binding PadR family transcriptional regulator